MKARRSVLGSVLALGLAASGLAQEAGVSVTAGCFLANESVYREIYGASVPFMAELWLKTKGPFGLATGFAWLNDDGLAIGQGGGDAEYPLELRRATIPVIAFFQLDLKAIHVRVGAGLGIHKYRELWLTEGSVYEGNKVSPRFTISASTRLSGRLSLVGTFVFENVSTGAGSVLSSDVNLGGYQFLGGVSYRLF